jgi:two-component system response regulator YesN
MGAVDSALYSFIIVDDEPEIRDGIRDNIPWSELGFAFAGGYANGTEALEAVEREAPDAMMTDINMPFMDGLALSERVHAAAPDTKILILTGYDDFEYARKALQLQVHDFILKPVTPEEFKKTLAKLKLKLDEEHGERRDYERLKRQLAETLPLLRERFLNELLVSGAARSGLAERMSYLSLPIPTGNAAYIALVLDFDRVGGGEQSDMDVLAERNLIEASIPDTYPSAVFQDSADRVVVLAWAESADQLYRESLKVAESLRSRLVRATFESIAVGIGEGAEDLSRVGASYQEALRALTFARISGGKAVVAYREMLGKIGRDRREGARWGKLIGAALKTGNLASALDRLNEMIDAFRASVFDPDEYYRTLRMNLASILQILDDLEIPEAEIIPPGRDPFSEVRELVDLEAARSWFAALAADIARYLENRQENFARTKVREAAEYLEERYGESDLSLASTCKDLYISTSYFSAVFKKYQEKTFVEFLTELRMRKAMELLRTTNLKTYEIALRVGYRDAHYFSLSFRKATGATPTAYRTGRDDEES